jgi:hypothetical protein
MICSVAVPKCPQNARCTDCRAADDLGITGSVWQKSPVKSTVNEKGRT